MESVRFLELFGINCLAILLVGGLFYWIKVLLNKANLNFKWWFKYKFLRKSYNEGVVKRCMENAEKGVSSTEFMISVLKGGQADYNKAKELTYIYNDVQKRMKGGKNKK